MLISQIRNLSFNSRPTSSAFAPAKSTCPQQDSRLLQLPREVRDRILKFAFIRTPLERIRALHFGPSASSASGLLLACRLLHEEAVDLQPPDAICSLWPSFIYDGFPNDNAILSQNPVMTRWKQSRHYRIAMASPATIKHVAWQFNFVRDTTSVCGHFMEAKPFKPAHFQPRILYIRVCICDALVWLYERPSYVTAFCVTLEIVAARFPSLEEIHIVYCGKQWPAWVRDIGDVPFASLIMEQWRDRMYSGSNWTVRRLTASTNTKDDMTDHKQDEINTSPKPPRTRINRGERPDVEGFDSSKDLCRMRVNMTWNDQQAHPGEQVRPVPWSSRSVKINFYDSHTMYGERCVRNKPPRNANASEKRQPALVREKTSYERGKAKLRHLIEDKMIVRAPFLLRQTRFSPDGERDVKQW